MGVYFLQSSLLLNNLEVQLQDAKVLQKSAESGAFVGKYVV